MAAESQEAAPPGDESVPEGYDPQLYRIRHSLAHVMAEAVDDLLGPDGAVEFAIGPPTEDGFYYDFKLPRALTDADLPGIEQRMREIIAGSHEFSRRVVDVDEARELFKDQPF